MKFLAALMYATAAAAGHGVLLDTLWVGALVFTGTLCALLALEHMIQAAVNRMIANFTAARLFPRSPDA